MPMRCEGPLKEQERSIREYRWKAESDPTRHCGGLGFQANTGKFQNVRLSGHRMNILQRLGKLCLTKWLGKPCKYDEPDGISANPVARITGSVGHSALIFSASCNPVMRGMT